MCALRAQINDPSQPLAFGFAGRNDPALVGSVHMPCFDSKGLLRTTPRLPGDRNQIPQGVGAREFKNLKKLNLADDNLTPFGCWSLKMLKGVLLNVALARGPSETSLDAANVVPS